MSGASATRRLYRPVGPEELKLIEASEWRAFPPRLPEQPIFYPVLNEEYAAEIAERWNAPESGEGFVTAFDVDAAYLARFTRQQVGDRTHEELWVPAEELDEFNRHIVGPIRVVRRYRRVGSPVAHVADLAVLGISEALIRARGLEPHAEAEALVLAEIGGDGREHWLAPKAASAWRAMRQAASADGIEISIVSAFRSIARQHEIVGAKLAAGQTIAEILQVSAPPGYSEHHTGRAVDLGTPAAAALELEFEQTAAYAWLADNAHRFGYRLSYPPDNPNGYCYEPWHWCYRSPA